MLTIAGGIILGVLGTIAIIVFGYWAVKVRLGFALGEGLRGFIEGMKGTDEDRKP